MAAWCGTDGHRAAALPARRLFCCMPRLLPAFAAAARGASLLTRAAHRAHRARYARALRRGALPRRRVLPATCTRTCAAFIAHHLPPTRTVCMHYRAPYAHRSLRCMRARCAAPAHLPHHRKELHLLTPPRLLLLLIRVLAALLYTHCTRCAARARLLRHSPTVRYHHCICLRAFVTRALWHAHVRAPRARAAARRAHTVLCVRAQRGYPTTYLLLFYLPATFATTVSTVHYPYHTCYLPLPTNPALLPATTYYLLKLPPFCKRALCAIRSARVSCCRRRSHAFFSTPPRAFTAAAYRGFAGWFMRAHRARCLFVCVFLRGRCRWFAGSSPSALRAFLLYHLFLPARLLPYPSRFGPSRTATTRTTCCVHGFLRTAVCAFIHFVHYGGLYFADAFCARSILHI